MKKILGLQAPMELTSHGEPEFVPIDIIIVFLEQRNIMMLDEELIRLIGLFARLDGKLMSPNKQ